ncbi:MAG TPA: DUF1549 and DUF1553 domain-containing protein [Pirellulales bacterium]|nr:DUF1549 and DUF1553 domain-containing protein [Pirellulales bacterium]
MKGSWVREITAAVWCTIVSVVAAVLVVAPATFGDEPYGRFQFSAAELDHWAYAPVRRPEFGPEMSSACRADWVKNPVDIFVLHELQKAGLRPAPPADPRTLVRRAYFDLLGLPPSPAEVRRFLEQSQDRSSPDAFARLVEELLARPEYGERWGRHWLDVVRYAESNGYERDGAKPSAWRYRDWVIDALNHDMPYDEFVRQQLAGDELPGSNGPMQIATTFLRLGPWDDEPAEPVIDRYDQLDDVVGATTAAFLAQTVRCARCHDHKFEPFSQRDYSRLLAVFAPLKRPQEGRTDLDRYVGTPEELAAYRVVSERFETELSAMQRQADECESAICRRLSEAGVLPAPPAPVVPVSRWEGQTWRYTSARPEIDWFGPAFDDESWSKGKGGFGMKGTPAAVVRTPWASEDIWLRRHFDLTDESLAPEVLARLQLLIHHDDEAEIYLNGVLAAEAGGFLVDYQTLPISADARAALKPGDNLLAVHCHQTSGGQYIDVGLVADSGASPPATPTASEPALPLDAVAAFQLAPERRGDEPLKLVRKYRSRLRELIATSATVEDQARLAGVDQQLGAVESRRPVPQAKAYVWIETGNDVPHTHVLHRGDPADPREEVAPGVPAIFVDGPLSPPAPTDHSTGRRRQLAEWLTRADHPLTSRVMVNRIWQHHFGDGLVGTENDFGVMGESPTHPELLDWLACEFVARGWSIKQLHRLIMLSNTYQMSATANPAAAERDPGCRLLWRFSPRRLEAEAIRDAVLSVSGQLNRERGGASVFPAIAPEVLASQSRPGNGWGKSSADQAARRSVYVFVKRTLLVPELEVLDFPDTNGSCEQRQVSTVAPQALTLLNGQFMQTAARHFAGRLAAEAPDAASRIERAYELALSRGPSDAERAAVLAFLADQERQIRQDLIAASQDTEGAVQQALAAFCLVLLNTNEFAYLR